MRGEPQGNSDPPGEAVLDDSESDAPDMESARWEDIDPSFSTVLHSLRRAIAKARLRATWLLAAFIVGTLVTLVVIRTRKAVHVAQVTFRVKDDGNASLSATDAELRQMLSLNYFTLPALLAIVEKHNLYERRRARAGYLAVESFREDIRVEATRYENQEEGPTGERLALRVKITFTHADGAVSKAVAGDLADLVVTGSRATLAARHQIVIKQAKGLADAAFRTSFATRHVSARIGAGDDDRADRAEARAKRIENELAEAIHDRTAAELRAAEDLTNHDLEFQIIDSDVRVKGAPLPLGLGFILAIAVSAPLVFLGSILFGAGTSLVVDESDLRELDLLMLVSLPLQRSRE